MISANRVRTEQPTKSQKDIPLSDILPERRYNDLADTEQINNNRYQLEPKGNTGFTRTRHRINIHISRQSKHIIQQHHCKRDT